MPLKFGSTTVANVDFVDMQQVFMLRLDKIIYNGTTVFERQKTLTTVTEKVQYTYYYSSNSSGASFRYPAASLQLSHDPVKVTSIGGLPGGSGSIASSGLSGTMRAYSSTGQSSSYVNVPWSVSGSILKISAVGTSGSTKSTTNISITYQYYA